MSETLTFIHAADLHIGAPFRGLRALSDEWARRFVDAIPGAWDRVVEAAVSRKVDFVVVSGDIFDSVRASYRDYLRFFDGLNRLDAEGIPSYLCTGNHDPLSLWQQDFFALPPSATMLAADRPDFALFMGPEQLTAESVMLGAAGGVNGGANVFPELYVALYEAAAANDLERVKALQHHVMAVAASLYTIGRYGSSAIKGIK